MTGSTGRPVTAQRSSVNLPSRDSRKHDWIRSDDGAGTPVLRCARFHCHVIWWPDRLEPQKGCEGS